VVALTQGNPFFLEESVQALIETRDVDGAHGGYRLGTPLPMLPVPATVQAVLAARIDRLPPEEKRLVQIAAVIGMEVPLALLLALTEQSEEVLRGSLAHLQAAEFLYETSFFPASAYTFKHALTYEVAYESLLQDQRRVLHARIVEILEALAGDQMVEQVERLAHHAQQGEVWDKAVQYGRQAGEKALARSAYREAVAALERALGALQHLPETRDTREQAIDLWLTLRSALYPSGDFGRILAALRAAEELAIALDDPRRLSQISDLLSVHFKFRGAYDQAIASGQRALALATAGGDVVLHALVNMNLGSSYYATGDYRRALDCFQQTAAFFKEIRRHERFGHFFLPAVQSRGWLASCHAEIGRFTDGITLGEEGIRIAKTMDHARSLMLAYHGIGQLALVQGDLPRALAQLERAVGICRAVDIPLFFPRMATALGAAYTLAGRGADAMPLLTQALAQTTVMARGDLQTPCHLALGEALALVGRLEEAQAIAERALALTRQHQQRGHQAYALRLLGELAARFEPPECDQAGDYYRQALALAEELGMRPLQAHCHRGLGTLYAKTGQTEQARAALSTAIALYSAMDMTFWLPQTEAALAQLCACYNATAG
jgi:tetratricopeptide (TPR) repeat protein